MKKCLLFIFMLCSCFIYGQGEANNWFFGENAGLNFNSGSPIFLNNGQLNTREGCSSFSDKDGNLLFYSDGTTVWNKDHSIMLNGTNLKGHSSSTQSAMIIPRPDSVNEYYLFTVGSASSNGETGFNYYTIDMNRDGGLGEVIAGPIDLTQGKASLWTEKVAAIKGVECNTYWVVSYVFNEFYAYKINNTGVETVPITSPGSDIVTDRRGYLKISPDGKKLAIAHMSKFNGNNQPSTAGSFLLYDFNNATGEITNKIILPLIAPADRPYGIEFSSNSEKLYVTASNDYYSSNPDDNNNPANHFSTLYQFNLSSNITNDIVNSRTVIDSKNLYRGGLQLGPDQKIYRALSQSYNLGIPFLGVIENPEEEGIACNYKHEEIPLGSNNSTQGLPPFIASIFSQIEITDGNSTINLNNTTVKRCEGENYFLQPQNIEGSPTYTWTFNGSIISNIAKLSLPNLSNLDEGIYYLEAETIDDCGFQKIYKGEVEIEVYQPPTITKPSNILQCDDNNDGIFDFNLNALKDTEVFNGQDPDTFEIVYFASQNEADLNQNPLPNPYTYNSGFTLETIYVRIHNKNNSDCFLTESFTIELFESPNPSTSIINYSVCDSNTVGTDVNGIEEFDLTSKQTEILNGQSALDFSISYFTDATLTNKITSPTNFKNTTTGLQPIFVEVQNINNSDCSASTSFNIEVFELPTINPNFIFKQCDEDVFSDGFTNFNLDEANEYLTKGDTNLIVTYFASFNDAETNNSPIVSAPHNNNTLATVFARIENINGCHRVAQVDLLVSATSFPAGYLKVVSNCDDDDTIDGIREFDLSLYETEIIDLFPSGQNLSVTYYRNFSDAQLEINMIPTDVFYQNETPFNQTLFVRVESDDNGECFGMGAHLQLIVKPRPEFEIPETEIYCQNLPYVEVQSTNPLGVYTYKWFDSNNQIISTNSNAFIETDGVFTVIATSPDGCQSFPQIITVEPSIIATITQDDITIVDDSQNNSISISKTNLGIGNYEFALSDIDTNIEFSYQDEPYFENVAPGIHTILINDKNNCGIASIDISVIGYPKFFTPNNDGFNDTWQIQGVNENFYATSNIEIFNRFGKMVAKISPKGDGWNGTYDGLALPSSDYWFSVELIDNNGNSKIRKGHFSLIRH